MASVEFADDWFGDECADRDQTHAGYELRQARTARGLSLEEVSGAIRIKPEYLAAIEEADTLALPPRTYAVCFARNYANYLGLDADHIAEGVKTGCRFKEGYKPSLIEPETPPERRLPKGVAGGLMVLMLAAVAMTWYGYNVPANSSTGETPPVPDALAEWSFDEAPAEVDESIWDRLGAAQEQILARATDSEAGQDGEASPSGVGGSY